MRDNLLFTGLPETQNENPERTVRDLIRDKLGINETVHFERVHRVGRQNNERGNKPRPIVAKFASYKQREFVRSRANRLKGTRIGINEQFSREVNNKRRVLYPELKKARQQNKYARLQYDYLIVEDEKFKVDDSGRVFKDTSYHGAPPTRAGGQRHEQVLSRDRRDSERSIWD